MEKTNLILIAEDDAVLGIIMVKQLAKLGYIGHLAENGQQAVLLAAKFPYCLILMDIHMPKLDGIGATIQIRNTEIVHIPIVAVTATADQLSCRNAGMDDFLRKPITLEQLRSAIEKWLGPIDVPRLI